MYPHAWKVRYALSFLAVFILTSADSFSAEISSNPVYTLPAVNPFQTIEEFPSISARHVRFSIRKSSSRSPGFDEIEVFTDASEPRNVALVENGATYEASSTIHSTQNYQPENVGNGLYGRKNAWVSAGLTNEWIEITFARKERINRIVWSSDRTENVWDRAAVDYQIEVAEHRDDWTTVATSAHRRPGLAFPPVKLELPANSDPALSNTSERPPLNSYRNEDVFPSVLAREIRFTILDAIGDYAKVDEIEIYSTESIDRNMALASSGAVAMASNDAQNVPLSHTKSQVLIDGIYGNDALWSGDLESNPWIKIRLPRIMPINRVVWSRDRTGKQFGGTPTRYRIEVLTQQGEWQPVASSQDRRQLKTLAIAQASEPPSDYLIDSWPAIRTTE